MNSNILISVPALLVIAMLVVLYVRTFGVSGKAPLTTNGKADASGRTLGQRLDGSEASFREG